MWNRVEPQNGLTETPWDLHNFSIEASTYKKIENSGFIKKIDTISSWKKS